MLTLKNKISKVSALIGMSVLSFFASVSTAMGVSAPEVTAPSGMTATTDDLADIVSGGINSVFAIAVVIAVVMVVWQGFKLISGNPQAAENAKGAIFRIIIGLAIIVFSWVIIGAAAQFIVGL